MEANGMEKAGTMRIVIVGHVDHGKSTLIGRACALPSSEERSPKRAASW